MEIKEIYLSHEKNYCAWKAQNQKVQRLKEEACEMEHRAAENRAEADRLCRPVPSWLDGIVVPISKELARRKGLQSKVLGPMGIAARVTIVLLPNAKGSIYEQESYRLTLQPDIQGENVVMRYETGEVTEDFEDGTLGAASGLNFVTTPLPNTFDEIEKLLVKYSPINPRP